MSKSAYDYVPKMEIRTDVDSNSSLSDSNFDSESNKYEFRFFSSSSSLFSSSSSSFFSENDLWSDTSFSFSSDEEKKDHTDRTKTSELHTQQNQNIRVAYSDILENYSESTHQIQSKKVPKKQLKNDPVSQLFNERTDMQIRKDSNNHSQACSTDDNSDNPFCDICGEVFNSQATLDVHKLDHLISETYTCEICQHVTKNREDYALHFRIHDQSSLAFTGTSTKKKPFPTVPYRCDICGKTFRFSSSFKRHVERHNLSHICSICSASFPTQLLCHQHKLKHVKKKVHKCEVCEKIFQRPHQLSIHMQVHETEKKYECKECGTSYCYKTSLMRHSLKYHSPNSPKFQCDLCGELFKNKKTLNGHVILHTAKKLIQCSDCSQTFKYRSSYHRHRVIHLSSKPFRCNTCGKQFKTESVLKEHKLQHVQNAKYVCYLCHKSFAFESYLDKHMLIHEEDVSNKNTTTDQSD